MISDFDTSKKDETQPSLLFSDDAIVDGSRHISECIRETLDNGWREVSGCICSEAKSAFYSQKATTGYNLPCGILSKENIDIINLEAENQFLGSAPSCDSPIEQMLLAGLVFVTTKIDGIIKGAVALNAYERMPVTNRPIIKPQAKILECHVDFLLVSPTGGNIRKPIAIECDGHEFHGTWKAKNRDNWREVFTGYYGIPTIRFSGDEIYKAATTGLMIDLISSKGVPVT